MLNLSTANKKLFIHTSRDYNSILLMNPILKKAIESQETKTKQ
jgi:hypothetical protein